MAESATLYPTNKKGNTFSNLNQVSSMLGRWALWVNERFSFTLVYSKYFQLRWVDTVVISILCCILFKAMCM